eukprot:230598-Amphidinium_carterae.2
MIQEVSSITGVECTRRTCKSQDAGQNESTEAVKLTSRTAAGLRMTEIHSCVLGILNMIVL